MRRGRVKKTPREAKVSRRVATRRGAAQPVDAFNDPPVVDDVYSRARSHAQKPPRT